MLLENYKSANFNSKQMNEKTAKNSRVDPIRIVREEI